MIDSTSTRPSAELIGQHAARVAEVCGVPSPSRAELLDGLDRIARSESWFASRRAEIIRSLGELPGSFPEADVADTTGTTLNAATKETDRANTLQQSDAFADALDAGDIRTGHVDALTRATKNLTDQQARSLIDQQEELARVAGSSSIRDFEKHIRAKAKALETEQDAEARLDKQRRDTRLRTWVDRDDGMWRLSGRFDPVTGQELHRVLDSATRTIFSEATPDSAPADPLERADHLRGLALARLLTDDEVPATTRPGDPIVVIDATTAAPMDPDRVPTATAEWAIPVEVPQRVLIDILGASDPDVVVVADGVILHAPGRLNLGRSSRIANRDQRRALRGLYSTCAVPGCAVHYDRCRLHHVIWWRHGGLTDLDNLLPVCQHHHTRIHNDNWDIVLGPNRELTIDLPDGQRIAEPPPKHRAA